MKKVYPIKDKGKLEQVINGLANYQTEREKRIYLLFMIGICTGLRIGDIIRLRVGQVNHGDKIRIEEEKTGKRQEIKINRQLRAVLDAELDGAADNDFLFPSRQRDRRGRVKHITVSTAENDLRDVAYWFNIRAPFSCHSLRKTYGYWHYWKYRNLEMLRQQFKHSDLRITSNYIGLDDDEIARATEHLFDGVFEVPRKVPAKKRSNQVNEKVFVKHHERAAQKKAYKDRMIAGKEKAKTLRERPPGGMGYEKGEQ